MSLVSFFQNLIRASIRPSSFSVAHGCVLHLRVPVFLPSCLIAALHFASLSNQILIFSFILGTMSPATLVTILRLRILKVHCVRHIYFTHLKIKLFIEL